MRYRHFLLAALKSKIKQGRSFPFFGRCGTRDVEAFNRGHHGSVELFPDEPPVHIEPCPVCGGEVEIGLTASVSLGDGRERWSENGMCGRCGTRLTRRLPDTERPVVFMTRGEWRRQ